MNERKKRLKLIKKNLQFPEKLKIYSDEQIIGKLKGTESLKIYHDIHKGVRLKNVLNSFKQIHGNKYDYSKVIYVNAHIKVEIICKKHGSFFQTPESHRTGSGCPDCAGAKPVHKQVDVINKFRKIHGNKYDYSKVIYVNAHIKVEIICKKHGSFFQSPNGHLSGRGCQKCNFVDVYGWTEKELNKLKKYCSANFKSSKKELKIIFPSKSNTTCLTKAKHMGYNFRKYSKNDCIKAAKTCKNMTEMTRKFSRMVKAIDDNGWRNNIIKFFK